MKTQEKECSELFLKVLNAMDEIMPDDTVKFGASVALIGMFAVRSEMPLEALSTQCDLIVGAYKLYLETRKKL